MALPQSAALHATPTPTDGSEPDLGVWMAVDERLASLLPRGLQRGMVLSIDSVSLLYLVLSRPSQEGSWVAVVGCPWLGLLGASEVGVSLQRLAVVPQLDRSWPATVAALIDAVDIVVLHVGTAVRNNDARRLSARARERKSILMLLDTPWPEQPPLRLQVEKHRWSGIAEGHGYFTKRTLRTVASGRGLFAQQRRATVLLDTSINGVVQ